MTARRRVGLVDMGSNAIRTEIVEFDDREWRTLEKHRAPVRLGGDVFGTGALTDESIALAVDAMREFAAACDQHAVDAVFAVATSAAREAENGAQMLTRIRDETGVEVRTITGMEEAKLLRAAVDARLDTHEGSFVLLDVGGGSVEHVRIDGGRLAAAGTYPIGALRVLREIGAAHGEQLGRELIAGIEAHIEPHVQKIARELPETPPIEFIATGGNIESIADLISQERDAERARGVQVCRRKHVTDLVLRIAELPLAGRQKHFRLRPDRADTIVPAGIVYARIAKLAGAKRIAVPRVGIRSGLRAAAIAGQLEPGGLVD